jgi:deoxyribose-phosphate aldolase
MDIKSFLDSTYLKTAKQAGITDKETTDLVTKCIQEAIDEHFKLVMIRPEYVALAKKMIHHQQSKVLVGTVISFPEGTNTTEEKRQEINNALQNGADDIDVVCNYSAFKNGQIQLVKQEIQELTKQVLDMNKTIKWIIEVAALSDAEIIQLSCLIKNTIITHFKEEQYQHVFVKSSTGFFETKNGQPNGATLPTIILMLENASPLPIKAAGGVKNHDDALAMIQLGVKRIGTSAAKAITDGTTFITSY